MLIDCGVRLGCLVFEPAAWRGRNPYCLCRRKVTTTCYMQAQRVHVESFFSEKPVIYTEHSLPAIAWSSTLNQSSQRQSSHACRGVISLLKTLSKRKAISQGRLLHANLIERTQDSLSCVGNAIIQMYGDCGSFMEAHAAFDKISKPDLCSWTALIRAYGCNGNLYAARDIFKRMPEQDVVAWTALMASYTQHQEGEQALLLFYQMVLDGRIMPDIYTFSCALDACSLMYSLEKGRLVHAVMAGICNTPYLVSDTALITLYGNCGTLLDAKSIFEKSPVRDVVCWNAMIAACINFEHHKLGLFLFNQMQVEGVLVNNVTYVHVLNICASLCALDKGKVVHLAILNKHFEQQTITMTAVINMYGRCKSICSARKAFTLLNNHDIMSWTSMAVAYFQSNKFQEALDLFYEAQLKHVEADSLLYSCAVDSCAELAETAAGMELHVAVMFGEHSNKLHLQNALFNLYLKCECFWEAQKIFGMLPVWNDSIWNLMIEAYIDRGHFKEALHLLFQPNHEDLKLREKTCARIINACTDLYNLTEGSMVHVFMVENSKECQVRIESALIMMYGKCRKISDAKTIFDSLASRDVVAWNAMTGILVHNENFREALNFFHQAIFLKLEPSDVSFLSAIEACTGLSSLDEGYEIHAAISCMCSEVGLIMGTALIKMYGSCGCLSDAESVWQSMNDQDVVAFTAMIATFVQNRFYEEALQLFSSMLSRFLKPDDIICMWAVEACSNLAALEWGQRVHMITVEIGYEHELALGTSIISMFGSCGIAEDAQKVFEILPHCDIVTWNAILGVFAYNGNGMQALLLLSQLQQLEIIPDCTTFICILCALSHEGLIDDSWYLLSIMKRDFGSILLVEHYVCMVDILGRAGQLHALEVLLNFVPFQSDLAWRCLLGACKVHGNLEFGKAAAKFCFEWNVDNDAPYVMLSNLYAAVGMEDASHDVELHECDILLATKGGTDGVRAQILS